MLQRIDERTNTDRLGRKHKRKVMCFQCDHCGHLFETKYNAWRLLTLHMCSSLCRVQANRSGGVIQEKQRQTALAHYGVDHPLKSRTVRDKIKRTLFERYGVENALKLCSPNSPEACKKRHETMKKTGGYTRSAQKCHETMKKNGTYGRISKQETMLYDLLVEKFGEQDVERQVLVNERWPIDFYINSIDTYVQYDSEYWHGLDRPIELIATSQNSRDRGIYCNWLSDRTKNDWFSSEKLNLVRIVHGRGKISRDNMMRKLEAILITKR